MKRLKILSVFLGVVILLVACGKHDINAVQDNRIEERGIEQKKQNLEEQLDESLVQEKEGEGLKKCTYLNKTPDSRYIIDMVEYPDWDSGEGKLEGLEDDMYLGVSNYNNLTSLLFEDVRLEEAVNVTDIPKVMEKPIADMFNEVQYDGGDLSTFDFLRMDYMSIEDKGEVNGYPMCRFEGYYVFDDEKEIKFAVVGYTTFLKQSGYPIYVATIDASEGQVNVEKLDKVAYDCMVTLQEVTEEEIREMGY